MGSARSTIKCSTLFCNAPAGKGNRDQQQQQQMQQLLQIVAWHFHTTLFFSLSFVLAFAAALSFRLVRGAENPNENFQLLQFSIIVLKLMCA